MDNTNAQTKVPFYMTYPMQNLYLMEMEYEKDMERMKELYPARVRQLMPHVEDFCDGLEYEGSRIYDENPDARMMREACEKLQEQIRNEQMQPEQVQPGHLPQRQENQKDRAIESASLQNPAGVRCSVFALNPPEGWGLPSDRGQIRSADVKQPVEVRSPADVKQPAEKTDFGKIQLKEDTSVPDMLPPDELRDLVGLLFADEIYRRRCRHRRCRRWW